MISTRSAGLVIDTVVCLTLAKWETVSGQFGGYLTRLVAWLAHGDTGDEVDHFAEQHPHRPSSAGRLWSLGRTPFRPGFATSIAAIASSISLPMLGCLALA